MSDQDQTTKAPTAPGEDQDQINPGTSAPLAPPVPPSGQASAAPLLMGVKLSIRVLLGRTQLCLRDIAELGNGPSWIGLSPDDPVEIIVNDRVIARGEVVVVSGNYGVRITKIASRNEKPEAEEAASDLLSLSGKIR